MNKLTIGGAAIASFFAHLASQGKLPKAKTDAPDATSH